jgi:hypothetical protein
MSRPTIDNTRKGKKAIAKISEIMLATIISPILKRTKKHHNRVDEILAIHTRNTSFESQTWYIFCSVTPSPRYATIDVSEIKAIRENLIDM